MLDCTFCAAQQATAAREQYNAVLSESENFVVLPAVGPLATGHVIVVAKEHAPNLLGSRGSLRIEYRDLLDTIRRANPVLQDGLLEAEHGATADERGGACITHTHVNLIPGLGRFADGFDHLSELSRGTLEELSAGDEPYLLVGSDGKYRLYRAKGLSSQYIRRRVCELMGRDDWDWGAFPNHETIAETVKRWNRDHV